MRKLNKSWAGVPVALALVLAGFAAYAKPGESIASPAPAASSNLAVMCSPEAIGPIAATLAHGVVIKAIPNGPKLEGGTSYVPAKGKVPGYCRVTGSYVTNSATGKTANFIATFPDHWNGKYLQMGCSGSCGFLLLNDPASGPITVSAQGYPGQIIEKGYATFGNDLGHVSAGPSTIGSDWLKNATGSLDQDVLEDYLYRADLVMADMGKAFTTAFYSRQSAGAARIEKSYFSGCSQGGREALIAATRFPEKFDGIIAGSPASDLPGAVWHGVGRANVAQLPGFAKLTPGQTSMLKERVFGRCDAMDGVKDGIIQNPAACDINPSRDFPICKADESGDSCISTQQSQNISAFLAGSTDESGRIRQPGFAISAGFGLLNPIPGGLPVDGDARVIIGRAFDGVKLVSTADAGKEVNGFHLVYNTAGFDRYGEVMRRGNILPEDFAPFLRGGGKLIWYHNLDDELLTPYMSINRYKTLAETHGGYTKLQRNIRFFAVPATGHCLMDGKGPGNFDAIGALEAWVEKGQPPTRIIARELNPATNNILTGKIDWSIPPLRTMPLCPFPQMAHYRGGDMRVAENWECRANDSRMLAVGVSGRQAGAR